MAAVPALRGVVVLSTCNRLALLVDADSWADTGCPAALDPALTAEGATGFGSAGAELAVPSDLGQAVSDVLAERAGLTPGALQLSCLSGAAARREMLAIASGLRSMVVGEAQISGQVRRAAETAALEGTLSPELVRVMERASATARRVAHETELSGRGRSVVAVGVEQAALHLPPLTDCRALIVGTGSYAGATVAALRAQGLTDIAVYSASNRAEAFAAGHDLRAVPAGALTEAMNRADLVVTCRGVGGPVLTAAAVAPVAAARRRSTQGADRSADRSTDRSADQGADPAAARPLVILDLALTRDVDQAVGALPGVVHLDLARVRDAVPAAEAQHVEAAHAIVEAEAADFERTLAGRAMDPLITALRAQVGRVVAEEAARLRPQPERRPALAVPAVPAVDGRAGTGVSGVNSADAAAGLHTRNTRNTRTCTVAQDHADTDSGFETVGEPMVPLAQAERALHHLAARLLHQPTVMARRAGQEGSQEAYRQALELVWGLEIAGGTHD